MAEANQPNYGKIGCVLILGIACIVGALIWFGGAGSGKNYVRAETYFNSPVSGLAVGSDVCFRGVKIGSVKRISFVGTEYANYKPEHGSTIWVGMALDPRLCGFTEAEDRYVDERISEIVGKGLHATLSANILTGIAHIELNFPKIPIVDEPITWKPRSLCIPPAPTLRESASDATVETQQGNLADILTNLRDASSALREFSYQIRDNPSLLLRSADAPPLPETK